jgi:predicted nuclease of predicted toxin-antitoxin system
MRILADMGVDVRVVHWLRQQGYDAIHLLDEGLHRMANGEIFAKAIIENRTIITFDLDFGEIVAFAKGQRVSVILFRLHNTRTSHLIDRLTTVLADSMEALEEGAVVVVEESRHRVRYLPVGRIGGDPSRE